MNCIHAKCATRLALSLPCSSPEEHARLAQEAGDLYRAGKPQEAARRLGYAGIERVRACRPDPDGGLALVAGVQSAGAYALATPLPMGWISPAQAWGDGAREALFQRGGYSPAAEEARARAAKEIEEIEARGGELPEGEIDFFNAGWEWFQRRFNEGFSLEEVAS